MENSHLLERPQSARMLYICRGCAHPIAAWEDVEGGMCEACEIAAYVEIIDPDEVL